MKRTPMKPRLTPMKRSTIKKPMMPKAPMKRITPKRKPSGALAEYNAEFRVNREIVRDRSRGVCEGHVQGVCTRRAIHVHHVVLRSQGGSNDPADLLDLCGECHTWAHANPAKAREKGLIRRREVVHEPPDD